MEVRFDISVIKELIDCSTVVYSATFQPLLAAMWQSATAE